MILLLHSSYKVRNLSAHQIPSGSFFTSFNTGGLC